MDEPDVQVVARAVVEMFANLRSWDDWMGARGFAGSTRSSYRYWIMRFMGDTLIPLPLVSEADVTDYLSRLPPRGESRNALLRALRSWYGYASDRDLTPNNPVKFLKVARTKHGPAPYLTDEELTRLVYAAACREERRGWAVLLAYSTGARVGSLCAVTANDVKGGFISFREAKGDRPYRVPLGRLGMAAVEGLKSAPRPKRSGANKRGTLLGVGPTRVWDWVAEAGREADLNAWPHLLRHSFATKVSEVTDPRSWQALMGHQDMGQFSRYVAAKDERLRAAVEAL